MLKRLLQSRGGSVATTAAVSSFAVAALAAVSVDGGVVFLNRGKLQIAADAAALAAAVHVQGSTGQGQARAVTLARMNMPPARFGEVVAPADVVFGRWDQASRTFTAATTPLNAVRVTARLESPTAFAGVLGVQSVPLVAEAIAVRQVDERPCILILDPAAPASLAIDSNARITAPDCRIHVNSSHAQAVSALSNSRIQSEAVDVLGGFIGSAAHYVPTTPTTGQPPLDDPLSDATPPMVGPCDHTNRFVGASDTAVLMPGVYCGGITIDASANVIFSPGVYVIKDGPLSVLSNASATGAGVGFYLTGNAATVHFDSNTTVNLTAPTNGHLAGFILFEDRDAPLLRTHRLDSNTIGRLEGALYLSRGLLSIDSNSAISAGAAFTTIVAYRMRVDSNADLRVNTNYAGSSVPNVMERRRTYLAN
jgi:Flp pilus assembly protein TadG